PRARILLLDGTGHRVDQGRLAGRVHRDPYVVHDHLDVLAAELVEQGQHLLLVPGQEAAVEPGFRRLRDDVDLVPALEHGQVRRVAQGAGDEVAGPAGQRQERPDVLLVPAGARDLGDPVEQGAHAGDELDREIVLVDRGDRAGEVDDGGFDV